MTRNSLLGAITACLLVIAVPVAPAVAAPTTPDGGSTVVAKKAKLTAELLDTKVKVHGKARIRGELDLPDTGQRGLELIVVQKLVAGVWVDVQTDSCRPNATFRLSVSFELAAQLSLRVFHPATATASATLGLTVVA